MIEGKKTLFECWQRAFPQGTTPYLDGGDLGTGSDYGGFVQHLGVPAINLNWLSDSENSYEAVYHSNYDNFYWMSTFGDPSFQYHQVTAQLWGVLAMRFASDVVLPFKFTEYAQNLLQHSADLQNWTVHQQLPTQLNFTNFDTALSSFLQAATSFDASVENYLMAENEGSDALILRTRALNDALQTLERGFLYYQGLKGREWYRHLIWATSDLDGYGSGAFSCVSDAITRKDVTLAQHNLAVVTVMIEQATELLQQPV